MENFASNFSHVKILFGDKDSSNPRCAHGPTLLMERGESRFYACAAYRSRKECDFYLTEGEALGQAKQMRIKASVKQMLEGKDHSVMYSKVQKAVEKKEEFNLCRGCDKVLEEESCCGETTIVTKQMLNRPSTFLMPKATDKKEAQHFFSSRTSEFFQETVSRLGFTDVLCVGCPSVFEILPPATRSLLLDLDPRLQAFHPPEKFIWFNFFNSHAFHGEKADAVLQNFLINSEKLVVIIDPPFGAKTELIWESLDRLKRRAEMLSCSVTISFLWVFPYFMEKQVISVAPELQMADYRVTYSKHKQFKEGKGERGSIVRIFTNINLSKLVLPSSEDYHYCSPCKRWVAYSNAHCEKCKACTSKDGRTYVHCNHCKRCVKPSYKHCQACARCKLPEHQCQPDNGLNNGEERSKVLKERKPTMGGKRAAPSEGKTGPKSKRKKLKQKGKKIYYGSKKNASGGQKKGNKQ